MLLITVNPDLERERRSIVTPIMRTVARTAILGWQLFALGGLTAMAIECYATLDPVYASGILLAVCGGCYGLWRSDLPPKVPVHGVEGRKVT